MHSEMLLERRTTPSRVPRESDGIPPLILVSQRAGGAFQMKEPVMSRFNANAEARMVSLIVLGDRFADGSVMAKLRVIGSRNLPSGQLITENDDESSLLTKIPPQWKKTSSTLLESRKILDLVCHNVMAIAYLTFRHSDSEDLWELQVDKARKWAAARLAEWGFTAGYEGSSKEDIVGKLVEVASEELIDVDER